MKRGGGALAIPLCLLLSFSLFPISRSLVLLGVGVGLAGVSVLRIWVWVVWDFPLICLRQNLRSEVRA